MERGRKRRGMTLLEAILTLLALGAAAAVAIPLYAAWVRGADARSCASERQGIEQSYASYRTRFDANASLLDYAEAEYGNVSALCPSGGQYVEKEINGQPTLLCTVHDRVDERGEPQTNP